MEIWMLYTKLRQGIIDTCLEMNRSGLNQGTSGNVSHRISSGMLITPTSLPYAQLKPADIVAMDFDGTYRGRRLPSSEWRFHRYFKEPHGCECRSSYAFGLLHNACNA